MTQRKSPSRNHTCPNWYAPKGRVLYYLTPAEERVLKAYRSRYKSKRKPSRG